VIKSEYTVEAAARICEYTVEKKNKNTVEKEKMILL